MNPVGVAVARRSMSGSTLRYTADEPSISGAGSATGAGVGSDRDSASDSVDPPAR
ncbi:hypothetical protein [Dactylosporangium cerinum]